MGSWQTKNSKIVYENPWLKVREDQIVRPNGQNGTYGVVESKSDAVFVVPVDEEGNAYIIQQEHYTTRELAWQCVAGRTDGERPEVAARRELLEEAGLDANKITILSKARTATGMTTFRTTLCLARGLSMNKRYLDKEEDIKTIRKFSIPTIQEMILTGKIANTESIAALLMAFNHLGKEKV
jgi:8-oxo-dGTP pyrophosphatase MutT (NUDIX family)